MGNYLYLKILDKFAPIFEKQGVSYPVLREILKVKITMDGRKQSTISGGGYVKKEKSGFKSFLVRALLNYGLMSVFMLFFFLVKAPLFVRMNLITGITMFMLVMALLADFSDVLLDQKDKIILMTKPIDKKVIALAKSLHIVYYIGTLALIMGLLPMIVGTILYGFLFPISFIITMLLVICLSMCITTLLYYVILKFFNGDKLRDMINYAQILMTIVVIFLYQVISRVFMLVDLAGQIEIKAWNFLLPSAWYGAFFTVFVEGNFEVKYIALIVVGLVVTLGLLWFNMKVVLPNFETYLSKMDNIKATTKTDKKQKKLGLMYNLTKSSEERSFILLYKDMIKNDRNLKLRTIPMMVMGVGFPFLMFLQTGLNVDGLGYLNAYMGLWMLCFIFVSFTFTDNPKGAWIYKALPISDKQSYRRALYKVVVAKYVFPTVFLLLLILNILFRFTILLPSLLIVVHATLATMIMFNVTVVDVPFSRLPEAKKGGTVSFLIGGLTLGVTAGSHALTTFIPYGVLINVIISAVLVLLVWKVLYYKKTKKLEVA